MTGEPVVMTWEPSKSKVVLLVLLSCVLGVMLFQDAILGRPQPRLKVSMQSTVSLEAIDRVQKGLTLPAPLARWAPPKAVDANLADPMELVLDVPEPVVEVVAVPPQEPNHLEINLKPKDDERGTPVQLDDQTPVFWVRGIVTSRTGRAAVILEDGVLQLHDEIYGARVIEIVKDAVTFEKEGKTYRVRVGQNTAD